MMLSGIMYGRQGGTEVLLTGSPEDSELLDMLEVLRTGYTPWTTVMLADSSGAMGVEASMCRNGSCHLPVKTAEELRDIL